MENLMNEHVFAYREALALACHIYDVRGWSAMSLEQRAMFDAHRGAPSA